MAKYAKPKKDHEYISIYSHHDNRYASIDDAKTLAQKHQIADIQEFHKDLNEWGKIYDMNARMFEHLPNNAQVETTLKQVHKLASKLATALDSLDEVSASRLYSAYVRIERTKPLPGFGGYMRDEAFSTTIKSPASLAQYAEEAERYKPTISKGRATLVSVETLILNLKSYWEDTLGRKFTYDEHEGEGITDAFLFCRDVCAVITPDIPATAIASKMRKLIGK